MTFSRPTLPAGFVLALSLFGLFGVGCTPATTYNRGIDISYHPSAKADADDRLVPSAVELKSTEDERVVRSSGGWYLGELEVTGLRSGAANTGAGGGAGTMAGRISLEAAMRGATHFYATSSSITSGRRGGLAPTSKTDVRFVFYRIERDGWDALPAPLRPEGPPTPAPVASH